jgi:hypothetical protein
MMDFPSQDLNGHEHQESRCPSFLRVTEDATDGGATPKNLKKKVHDSGWERKSMMCLKMGLRFLHASNG